jgi:hypothetical protein
VRNGCVPKAASGTSRIKNFELFGNRRAGMDSNPRIQRVKTFNAVNYTAKVQ